MRLSSLIMPTVKTQKTNQPFKLGMHKDTRSMLDYITPKKNKKMSSLLGM